MSTLRSALRAKLKPCPSCDEDRQLDFAGEEVVAYVVCHSCGMSGPSFASSTSAVGNAELAIAAWNKLPRRLPTHTIPETRREVQHLIKLVRESNIFSTYSVVIQAIVKEYFLMTDALTVAQEAVRTLEDIRQMAGAIIADEVARAEKEV